MDDLDKLEYWLLRGLLMENDEEWEFGFVNEFGDFSVLERGEFKECFNALPTPESFKFCRLAVGTEFEWNDEIWKKVSFRHAEKGTIRWPMDLNTWVKPV